MHIIWHAVPNDHITDDKEIVGICTTGWMDADAIVDRLNSEDEKKGFSWTRNYWKEEIQILTPAALETYITGYFEE